MVGKFILGKKIAILLLRKIKLLKFTEKEVRDHIRRYGIEHAGDTLKGVAKEMAAEQFAIMTQQKIPAFEMPNGDVLYVSYNKESDMIDIGPVTNAGLVAQHRFPYDHNASLLIIIALRKLDTTCLN